MKQFILLNLVCNMHLTVVRFNLTDVKIALDLLSGETIR